MKKERKIFSIIMPMLFSITSSCGYNNSTIPLEKKCESIMGEQIIIGKDTLMAIGYNAYNVPRLGANIELSNGMSVDINLVINKKKSKIK